MLPDSNFITVSQKIEKEEERQRLIEIVKQILPENMGAILRTAAENKTEEEIKQDIDKLIGKWQEIQALLKRSNPPKLLYDNQALIRRTIIDIVDRNLEKVVVNDKEVYDMLVCLLQEFELKIELKAKEDLFTIYD